MRVYGFTRVYEPTATSAIGRHVPAGTTMLTVVNFG